MQSFYNGDFSFSIFSIHKPERFLSFLDILIFNIMLITDSTFVYHYDNSLLFLPKVFYRLSNIIARQLS
jgi:hypothetical protein